MGKANDSESLLSGIRLDSRHLSTPTLEDRRRFEEKLKVLVENVSVEIRSLTKRRIHQNYGEVILLGGQKSALSICGIT